MKTASIIIIGNEILSGRTKDTNSNYLAKILVKKGIALREVRVIPDNHNIIKSVINRESSLKDYVFTSGGIGPTHDDITAEAVASSFDVPLIIRDDAVELLAMNYKNGKKDLNAARLRMARIPEGAKLIKNKISGAPGFIIKNVFVMAGVPQIFEAMVQEISEPEPPICGTTTELPMLFNYFGYQGPQNRFRTCVSDQRNRYYL